uniref:Uncharacterized protein n=1 Tax=Homalodisca liturata TaxID=320908 RepID=A0A1B6J7R8_9HEMI
MRKKKKLRTMNPFTGSPRTTRHYFQKTSKPLLRRRSTLVTQAGTKKPYTGFILTLRPRRPKKTPMNRLKSEVIFLKKTQKTTQDGNLITTVPPTVPPMRSSTETPIRPPVTSATWWPPGVYLGPRSRRPPLHPHIIQPALLKWERKFPKIWFRTGGTRFTYPPEVENYPFTFDWHVPKKKRVDRWTMRPDWPLDSPLFKDNIPDYIEDVTLPPIPEMGETLYPKTSPKPWWTYPPWWEQKIAAEANGTTPRTPRTLKTSKPTTIDILKIFTTSPHKVSRTKMNTELTFDLKNGAVRPIKEVSTQTARKTTVKRKPTLTFTLSTSQKSPENLTPTTASMRLDPIQQKKVVHHVGPWWKLTIVEHVPHPNFTHSGDTSGVRLKRSLRKHKGLVRQNAIRRKKNFTLTLKSGNKPFPLNIYLGEPSDFVKRESSKLQLNFDVYNLGTSLLKQNDSSFHKISEIFKSKLKNISASTIKRKFVGLVRQNVIREKHISTEQKKNYINPICSQLKSPDLLEKKEIELQLKLNFSNFDKPLLNQNVSSFSIIKTIFKAALKEINARRNQETERFDLQTISNFMEPMKMPFELKNHLISLLPSLLKKQPLESRKANLFYALTGEIRRYILNIMKIKMFDIKAMLKYKASDLRIKSESKLRIVHFLKLFYKPKLDNGQWTRSVLKKYGGTKCMVQGILHKQERKSSSLFGIQQSITDTAITKHLAEHLIREKREEKPIELGVSSFNWSSHSMENVVDELVNELPMKTIKKEVKKDMITELHKGMMQKFGRTDINEAVVSRMAKIEAEEANPTVDKVMENSVREVIQKLLDEVLTTLRQNTWMKTSMVKLFEEGYSVESVVDAISNQISISSLLDSMEKEGVNITQSQRHLVLTEFKDYKQLLNRMLKKEVELWEYQLLKNPIIARRKRNTLLNQRNEKNLKLPVGSQKLFRTFKKRTPIYSTFETNRKSLNSMNKKDFKSIFRDKRAIGDSGFMEEEKSEYDEQDLNIDKELSAIEKSSMSDGRKIKKLKKHLKWLQSQTQSPAEIIFPENFEEDLMRTEGYDDEGSDSKLAKPKRFKQKFQWRVRTKKPTLKVITFLPKIRLTRGRPFMPLTTTEETLVIPETHLPTRKRKTKTPRLFRKVIDPTFLTTQPLRKPIWLDLSQKTLPPRSRVLKARPLIRRTTSQPARTFAQMKSFKTMKFGQKTQQPVISLQEFLKRRNEFRRVREEVMWNKNFHTSSEELPKGKNVESLEQSEELTEETDLSFDGKLSMEVKPEDFTLRPLSDFLYTWPVMTTVSNSNVRETTDMPVPVVEGTKIPKKSKSVTRRPPSNSTRRRYTKKTGYTRASNRGATRKKIKRKIEKPSISGLEEEESKDLEVLVDSDVERNKRDISTTYSLRPFTSGIKQDGKVIPWRNKRDVNKNKSVTKEVTNESYQNETTEHEIKGVNETSHLIKKPVSSIVKKKQGMLMKYLYKIKDCVILKKTQIVRGVKACANQKMLENAALWVLGYVAKAYHYLRKKIEERANDSMEVKDLSMRS